MQSDAALLEQYARTRDADAFAEILRRYSRLVFGVARRVTGDAASAEDVAQECFVELACRAGLIRASLPGWLHRSALNHALQARRNASTRRRYEAQASRNGIDQAGCWSEIRPHVDEALAALPEELRLPIVQHYLSGRAQADIADEIGVDQSTISRRLKTGVEMLREHLRNAGVLTPALLPGLPALPALLSEAAWEPLSPELSSALGKLAISGVGGGRSLLSSGACRLAGAVIVFAAICLVLSALVVTALQRRGTADRSLQQVAPSPGIVERNMAGATSELIENIVPEIHVTDVEAAARLLEVVGFKRGYEYKEADTLDFVIMQQGRHEIYLHHLLADEQSTTNKPYRIYFMLKDAAAMRTALESKGYAPTPIEKTDYGALLFHLEGPDQVQFWFQQFIR